MSTLSVRRHGKWVVQITRVGEDYTAKAGMLSARDFKLYGSATGPDRDDVVQRALVAAEAALADEYERLLM